jgi:hypothetical protein
MSPMVTSAASVIARLDKRRSAHAGAGRWRPGLYGPDSRGRTAGQRSTSPSNCLQPGLPESRPSGHELRFERSRRRAFADAPGGTFTGHDSPTSEGGCERPAVRASAPFADAAHRFPERESARAGSRRFDCAACPRQPRRLRHGFPLGSAASACPPQAPRNEGQTTAAPPSADAGPRPQRHPCGMPGVGVALQRVTPSSPHAGRRCARISQVGRGAMAAGPSLASCSPDEAGRGGASAATRMQRVSLPTRSGAGHPDRRASPRDAARRAYNHFSRVIRCW